MSVVNEAFCKVAHAAGQIGSLMLNESVFIYEGLMVSHLTGRASSGSLRLSTLAQGSRLKSNIKFVSIEREGGGE